jgi:hypothetical protein
MRLHRHVLGRRRGKRVFEHPVRFGKGLFDISGS